MSLVTVLIFGSGLFAPLGCNEPDGDGGNKTGLPVDTSDVTDDDDDGGGGDAGTSWTGTITGGGPQPGDDDSPDQMLTLRQTGSWTLSPPAGPYDSISGTLVVTEILDGDEEFPACTAEFALTGVALPTDDGDPCTGCEASFEVLHYLSIDGGTAGGSDSGGATEIPGLSGCMAPDLPLHDETWVLGLASDGNTIKRRLGVSGWQSWYEADQIGATVSFEWEATVGLESDEDEETE